MLVTNDVLKQLTGREKQVLALVGGGGTTKEIAAALSISAATVSNHRKSLCRKLGVHSTAELAAYGAVSRRDLGP